MEIWVDHYYADHLNEGVMLYAPYIQSGAYDIEEVQKINDIADRLVGLQFLFEDAYRERTEEELDVDLPDQIKRLTDLLILTTTDNKQIFIPSRRNFAINSESTLKLINYMMKEELSVDFNEGYQYGFIDLYGAREDRCGKDYKRYGKLVQKLAGSNLTKLNSGIESMVVDAIKLSNQPWK